MAPTAYQAQTTANFSSYDHVTWYVSNAQQAADFYITKMGFKLIAYMGLETGSKDIAARVVGLGNVIMQFKSALRASSSDPANTQLVEEIQNHVSRHGDGVRDVAFVVDDVRAVYSAAIAAGATSIERPKTLTDKFGSVTTAIIHAYGDTTHTLINRSTYYGAFLPGYRQWDTSSLDSVFGPVPLDCIDHCVANQGWNKMEEVCEYYERTFGFHRFWSVDDSVICTEYSALSSIVMASDNNRVKMPVNQPAKGIRTSQVEEFVQFYEGPGVQHIALLTPDILTAVQCMKERGMEFITVPKSYYEMLQKRLASSKVQINESMAEIERLNLLVDFDNNGYLLQIFSKPVTDRPTIFFEIIQRNNFEGFGAGNFKSLFEAIERHQAARGTL